MINKKKPEGSWPEHCEHRAFVEGAAWIQYMVTGFTLFPSEREVIEAEAIKRYGYPIVDDSQGDKNER